MMAGSDDDLWLFVLRLYKSGGVAPACLRLQDACAVDVPILLFAAWLGHRSVPLDEATMQTIDGSVAEWRAEVVQSLRRIRQRLKSGPAPAPTPATDALRDTVKSAELHAEKLELAFLEDAAKALPPAQGLPTGPLVLANLQTALHHFSRGKPDDRWRADLALIAAAV